ncbi:MAG: hypothetical protein HZA60_07990, partial [Deltaproteobacteria bacterium]|nr:hypothetical protein [Deltaproteobacteria bacterium]
EKVVGDGTGKPLEKPEQIFTAGREVLKDNRIGPKETREITHVFPVGGPSPATAEVALTYEIPTPDIAPSVRMIELPISRTIVPARTGIPALYISLAALAVALLLLLAAFYVRRWVRNEGRT